MRFGLAAVMCVVAAVVLIGCGGGSNADGRKVLEQTFSGHKNVKSGRINLKIAADAHGIPGLNGPVTITLSGPFQSQGQQLPTFDLDVKLNANGRTFSAGAVSTGDKGFVKFQGTSYLLPDSVLAGFRQGFQRARAQRNSQQGTSLASLGIDPRRWVRNPSDEGDEDVAGQSTTHISSDIDVPKLLDDFGRVVGQAGRLGVSQNRQASAMLSERQKKAVDDAIEDPKIDVYSGTTDRILRKLTIALGFKVPKDQQQRANGLKSGKLSLDIELAEVNRPQAVHAPANAKPFSELRNALGGLAGLGGLVSGGGGTTSGSGASQGTPSTGSAGSASPAVQAYAQCVAAAGGDVSKTQNCAGLLPKR
jgi:hypothetical protein